MFVEDGDWTVKAMGLACGRGDADIANQSLCLQNLDGQKLVATSWDAIARLWRFHFDLGGSVTIAPPLPSDDDICFDQWNIFREDGSILTCIRDDTLVFTAP